MAGYVSRCLLELLRTLLLSLKLRDHSSCFVDFVRKLVCIWTWASIFRLFWYPKNQLVNTFKPVFVTFSSRGRWSPPVQSSSSPSERRSQVHVRLRDRHHHPWQFRLHHGWRGTPVKRSCPLYDVDCYTMLSSFQVIHWVSFGSLDYCLNNGLVWYSTGPKLFRKQNSQFFRLPFEYQA